MAERIVIEPIARAGAASHCHDSGGGVAATSSSIVEAAAIVLRKLVGEHLGRVDAISKLNICVEEATDVDAKIIWRSCLAAACRRAWAAAGARMRDVRGCYRRRKLMIGSS